MSKTLNAFFVLNIILLLVAMIISGLYVPSKFGQIFSIVLFIVQVIWSGFILYYYNSELRKFD